MSLGIQTVRSAVELLQTIANVQSDGPIDFTAHYGRYDLNLIAHNTDVLKFKAVLLFKPTHTQEIRTLTIHAGMFKW